MATVAETKATIDSTAAKFGFRCVPVSWEDAQRGTYAAFGSNNNNNNNGSLLSSVGPNISDVRLWSKDGQLLYTLRSQNWNERLGYVAAKDVAVVVGNHVRGGAAPTPITLQRYLKNFREYASYSGCTSDQLFAEGTDQIFSIRFQAVFLPVAFANNNSNNSNSSNSSPPTTEFCTEVYNYNTRSDDDPRNVTLLCTAQGTSVQQDGAGAKKLFLHSVDGGGGVHRYWLEAERSGHAVGGAQSETAEEAAAAAARGKATAIHIGTKAMGTRFNVQMLIQLPVQQKPRPPGFGVGFGMMPNTNTNNNNFNMIPNGGGGFSGGFGAPAPSVPFGAMAPASSAMSTSTPAFGFGNNNPSFLSSLSATAAAPTMSGMAFGGFSKNNNNNNNNNSYTTVSFNGNSDMLFPSSSSPFSSSSPTVGPPARIGTSNAARVSRGSEYDVWAGGGVANKAPRRDPSQHGTITVTLYYTVAGGVPSTSDVEACVADLEALYKACPTDKRLVDCAEITAELNDNDNVNVPFGGGGVVTTDRSVNILPVPPFINNTTTGNTDTGNANNTKKSNRWLGVGYSSNRYCCGRLMGIGLKVCGQTEALQCADCASYQRQKLSTAPTDARLTCNNNGNNNNNNGGPHRLTYRAYSFDAECSGCGAGSPHLTNSRGIAGPTMTCAECPPRSYDMCIACVANRTGAVRCKGSHRLGFTVVPHGKPFVCDGCRVQVPVGAELASCGPCDADFCSRCVFGPLVIRREGTGTCAGMNYCGLVTGTKALPGSDGFCGPVDGPQCADCVKTKPQL